MSSPPSSEASQPSVFTIRASSISRARRAIAIPGWIAGATLALGVAFLVDGSIDQWVAAHADPQWVAAAKFCSRYFAWHWLMTIAAIGSVIAWLRRRRDWLRVLCAMMIAASLAGLSADILRGATGRTRPYVSAPQGWYGVRTGSQWLITKHAYNSFPSGHVTAVVGFVCPLLFWRRLAAAMALPLVAMVASARVYLGAHHLSDTIAGAILGTLVALWVWRRAKKWRLFAEAPTEQARG